MSNRKEFERSLQELNDRLHACTENAINAYSSFLFAAVHSLVNKHGDDAVYTAFCGGDSIKAANQCFVYARLLDTDPPAIFQRLSLPAICEVLINQLFPIVVEKFVFDYSIEKFTSKDPLSDFRPLCLFIELIDDLKLIEASPMDIPEIIETYCQSQGVKDE